MWTSDNTFLTKRWLNNNNKTPREIVTYFEIDENEYATCQNVRDAATSVLTGKRVDVNAYVKKKKIWNQQPKLPR